MITKSSLSFLDAAKSVIPWYSAFSIERLKPKTKVATVIKRKEIYFKSRWELKVKPTTIPRARVDTSDQVVIGV